MNDLFDIPESHPPRLEQLRKELAEAEVDFLLADQREDEFGEPIPYAVRIRVDNARAALMREEQRLMGGMSEPSRNPLQLPSEASSASEALLSFNAAREAAMCEEKRIIERKGAARK